MADATHQTKPCAVAEQFVTGFQEDGFTRIPSLMTEKEVARAMATPESPNSYKGMQA
ncbi:hypothetical protein [Streptomyces mirabilis]|uniref:hypothetical protein n=1 Tax=Streptomyces mirabilis TaxID=68239 RepID=UPI0033273995